MDNQIVISADVINEDALGDLLSSMKTALDADGYMEKCFFITSEDPRLLAALHKMFDSGDVAPAAPRETKTVKKARTRKNKYGPQARWTIMGGHSHLPRAQQTADRAHDRDWYGAQPPQARPETGRRERKRREPLPAGESGRRGLIANS